MWMNCHPVCLKLILNENKYSRFSCNGTTVYYCSCDATCGSCGACETGTTDRCLKPGGGQLDVVRKNFGIENF